MNEHHKVHVYRKSDGEWSAAVLDARGIPVYRTITYAVNVLRAGSGSHATVEQGLRGVAPALDFAAVRGFDWDERIRSGEVLSEAEAMDLVSDLHSADGERKPGPNTVRMRVNGICRFIRKRANSINPKFALSGGLESALKAIKDERPRRSGKGCHRKALTKAQKVVLVEALREIAAAAEPGSASEFVAVRLVVYFEWAFEMGLRVGENLGVRIGDIDFERLVVRIVRRPDARDDDRRNPARVKGLGRPLPISAHLGEVTWRYICDHRAKRPLAETHDLLFVSSSGKPLSLAMIAKSFRALRRKHEELGEAFSPHVMRYVWNEWFSDHAARTGMSKEDEEETRMLCQGWRDPKSVRHYVSGNTQRLQREASLARQGTLFGGEAR